MVTVQNSGTGIAFRTLEPKRFHQMAGIPGITTRHGKKAGLRKDMVTPEESNEFRILDDFLAHHIQTDGLRDVQCMLLWSEWVRGFQKKTHQFPKVILENEFCRIVTHQLGIGIIHDSIRGAVYPGIRFVP